jgi:hypothetical protein
MLAALRPLLAALILCAGASPAFAGAASTPTAYQPDPALKTASRSELENRVRSACTIVQARLQNVSEQSLAQPCGCYASRTMRSLTADEIQSYRDTGVFNEGARAKALGAIDACRLQRPI